MKENRKELKIIMKKSTFSEYQKWLIGNLLFTFLFSLIIIYCSNSKSLWADEVFSLKLIDCNWETMIKVAKADVHPPLYYFILKIFISIFTRFGLDNIFIGKITSYIPVLLILVWLSDKVYKKSGRIVAILFNVCIIGMPNLLNYAVEIRGYSWAMFFVTASFLYAGDIINGKKEEKAWLLFTFFSILSAYVHYFACVAVVVIYFGILLFKKIDSKLLKRWCTSVLVACIAYIPWLNIFLKQMGSVVDDFWIEEITAKSLYSYFRFLFEPPVGKFNLDIIIGVVLAAVYIIMVIISIIKLSERRQNWELWGCVVLFLTVIIGIIVSMVIRPIFVSRYMIVAAGCFWLCFAWLIGRNREKNFIKILGLILIVLLSVIDIGQFIRWEEIRKDYYTDFITTINNISDDDIVITDEEHMQGCLSYYLGKEVVNENPLKIDKTIENIHENNKVIWFFYGERNKKIIEDLKEKYDIEFIGVHHLEYYTFEVAYIEK